MSKLAAIGLFLLCLGTSSCSSLKANQAGISMPPRKGVKYQTLHCPSDIKEICLNSRAKAKQIIEKVYNTHLSAEPDVFVVKRMDGAVADALLDAWKFWSEPHNKYICAYITKSQSSYIITVACNPNTGAVSKEVMAHEFAHYWLWEHKDIITHDKALASYFWCWED